MIKKSYVIEGVTNHPHFVLTDVIIDPLGANVSTTYQKYNVQNTLEYYKNRGIQIKGVVVADDGNIDFYLNEITSKLSQVLTIKCMFSVDGATPIEFASIDFNPRNTADVTPGDNPSQIYSIKVDGFSYNRMWSQTITNNKVYDFNSEGGITLQDLVTSSSNAFVFNKPVYTLDGLVLSTVNVVTGKLSVRVTDNLDASKLLFSEDFSYSGNVPLSLEFSKGFPRNATVTAFTENIYPIFNNQIHMRLYNTSGNQPIAISGEYRRLNV